MRLYLPCANSITLAASVTVPKTIFAMAAPSDGMIALASIEISQEGSEISEQLNFDLRRLSAAGAGTPGTTLTSSEIDRGDPGSPDPSGVYTINYSAEPTTYSAQPNRASINFNILNGYYWAARSKEDLIWLSPTLKLGLRLMTTLGQALELSVTAEVYEVGS